MNIAFRVDASLEMGIGHVMRCLTLANALYQNNNIFIRFICRHLPDSLHELLVASGFDVVVLTQKDNNKLISNVPHAEWLGVNQLFDAKETSEYLSDKRWDWLVVDHYAIDHHWQNSLRPMVEKIMVIDDLADRNHHCELLLDQTFNRSPEMYKPYVPDDCCVLVGAEYSMLRPEFMVLRPYSLKRRLGSGVEQLLITMGGSDISNTTGTVLDILRAIDLPDMLNITVVMGAHAPALERVKLQANAMPCSTVVNVNVKNMAQIMADSDLVIGAAGTTSWERCCLGVPSLMVVLADNQEAIAASLHDAGAAINLGSFKSPSFVQSMQQNILAVLDDKLLLECLGNNASKIVEGDGALRVMKHLTCENC